MKLVAITIALVGLSQAVSSAQLVKPEVLQRRVESFGSSSFRDVQEDAPLALRRSDYFRKSVIVTSIPEAGRAEDAGLMVWDMIYQAEGKRTSSPEELAKILDANIGKAVTLTVRRAGEDGGRYFSEEGKIVFTPITQATAVRESMLKMDDLVPGLTVFGHAGPKSFAYDREIVPLYVTGDEGPKGGFLHIPYRGRDWIFAHTLTVTMKTGDPLVVEYEDDKVHREVERGSVVESVNEIYNAQEIIHKILNNEVESITLNGSDGSHRIPITQAHRNRIYTMFAHYQMEGGDVSGVTVPEDVDKLELLYRP